VSFIAVRSEIVWDFTQRRLVVTDILGQLISPIFKGQAVQEEFCLTLEGGTERLDCPEKSVRNHPSTLHKISEEHNLIFTAAEA
jgi:hypothetical protein